MPRPAKSVKWEVLGIQKNPDHAFYFGFGVMDREEWYNVEFGWEFPGC
jgi:hypothetical protein